MVFMVVVGTVVGFTVIMREQSEAKEWPEEEEEWGL